MREIDHNNINPIGMFDSGIGGLSVWKEVIKLLPYESIVYFADSGNCPYGSKYQQEIIGLSDNIVRFLLSKRCKIIVVACNTATSAAIDYLRKKYPNTYFVGMEPAIKPAALNSQTGSVGILATSGTLKGRLFNETKARFASNIKVNIQVGEGLVELVEQDKIDTKEAELLLQKYIVPMLEDKIDYLVLGCSHYPFLSEAIRKIAGDELILLDPAPAIAQRTEQLLHESNLLNTSLNSPKYSFYTSGKLDILDKMIAKENIENYSIKETKLL